MCRFILLVLEDKFAESEPEVRFNNFQEFADDFEPPAGTRLVGGRFVTGQEAALISAVPSVLNDEQQLEVLRSLELVEKPPTGPGGLEARGAKF